MKVDEALYEELETALLQADCGVAATTHLLEALRAVHDDVDTLLDIDDPFADPIVVRSAAGRPARGAAA